MRERIAHWAQKILFAVSLLMAWEIVFRYGGWPDYLLPGPGQVGRVLWEGLMDGSFLQAAAVSLRRMIVAFSLALAGGLLLGFIMAESRVASELLRAPLAGLQSLPSICWFPLALLWLGLGEHAVAAVSVLGALFAVTSAVLSGLRHIPPIYLAAASTLGARGLDRYVRVLFPAMLPALVGGMRQGWSFAWRSLMAAELLFHNGGVGYLLMRARELNDVAQVISVILLILLVGAVCERLIFEPLEGRLRAMWGLAGSSRVS